MPIITWSSTAGARGRTVAVKSQPRPPQLLINVVRLLCFFFFQAEDGIRDYKVTGVQTCALPILSSRTPARTSSRSGGVWWRRFRRRECGCSAWVTMEHLPCQIRTVGEDPGHTEARSEERRVGKECRSRWSPDH